MIFNVLNPWMISIGLGALAVPLVVHWLTRPRPVTLPLSTIRFVREVVHQRRATRKLRDILILLMRMLAVALLAYAFARPLMGSKPLISGGESGSAVRIVVLDESASMGAVSHGVTPFERGRQRALQMLPFQQGLQANLILADSRPRPVFDRPSTNLAALRDALSSAMPQAYTLNIQQTVNRAADMLAKTDSKLRREFVIVSDFQRSNWSAVDFSPLPEDTLIQLESVAPSETPPNLAVLKVAPQGRTEQGQPAKFEIEIGNYSTARQQVRVELTLGDTVYHVEGVCPKGVRTTLVTEVTLPPAAGWVSGSARLMTEDALAIDNVRPFVVHVAAAPTFALITRESRSLSASSTYFVERALAPSEEIVTGKTSGRVNRIAPDAVELNAVAPANLIVIDHPGKLPPAAISLLANLVRRGKPMLYIAAEQMDAVNLRLLADAVGTDLKLPVQFVPPAAGAFRRDLTIMDARRDQAPFAIFGEDLPAILSALRFGGGLATPANPGGLQDDILATYSDRTAALVLSACGAGSIAILNADLTTSTLPSDPAFVPLLGELTSRLLSGHSTEQVALAGEPFAVYLPTEAGVAAGLKIVAPENIADAGVLTDENTSVLWRSSVSLPPGVYDVMREKSRVFALAVALSEYEADLTPISMNVLKNRLAGERKVDVHAAGAEQTSEQFDNTWSWVLAACIGCLLMEVTLLRALKT